MPLTLHRRGKVWHYRGTVAGQRLRGSTGAVDRKLAERIAAETEAAAWRSHLDGPGAELTFAQATAAYLDAGKPSRFILPILDHWKGAKVSAITAGAVQRAARILYPTAAATTLNRQVIAPTQAIINFAADLEWCGPVRFKRFKTGTPKAKTPATATWVRAFARQARADRLAHLAALCVFMFGTGARRGEACALTWADVELDVQAATIRQTKTSHVRTAHLPGEVVVALANIPSNRNHGDLVFKYATGESVGQVWANVAKRAGIAPLSPHCCRHGFATTMLQAGIDAKTVAVRGGWADAATVLKHYAHARDDHTVTDLLFDTKLARKAGKKAISNG